MGEIGSSGSKYSEQMPERLDNNLFSLTLALFFFFFFFCHEISSMALSPSIAPSPPESTNKTNTSAVTSSLQ
ncbi:hypothetical protein C5167_007946 [Papaver somniferum]|uniref:Uncharacterized protein n=1 Tax=Papaver somniferum TaxID=3469 RepID=A0A4Y7JX19_PAPSO|nr:hypothetical protein C5167_007946 [Papaver somniferum]